MNSALKRIKNNHLFKTDQAELSSVKGIRFDYAGCSIKHGTLLTIC